MQIPELLEKQQNSNIYPRRLEEKSIILTIEIPASQGFLLL